MKYVGHTMAIPGMDIAEGIRLFSSIGLDAIEIVAQEGTPFHIGLPETEIDRIVEAARSCGLEIVTLTPYFWGINSADAALARENIDGLCTAVRLAKYMGARYVRAYGGRENAGGTPDENRRRTVEALIEAGAVAQAEGITILVENHPGTMTRTGAATREVVDVVGLDCVRALYDPCNVMYDTSEDWLTTLKAQRGIIGYVHCKDYYMDSDERHACVVGEGMVPWRDIMYRLGGYDGYLCFEYEKRWYPDQLEDARTGLVKCRDYIQGVLGA